MKSAMIILSLFMSLSSMAAVSYNCTPIGRGGNETFMLTDLAGNNWSFQTSANYAGIFRQGTLSYDRSARTQAPGFDGFSGIVGYGSHDPRVMVPRNVKREVVFLDRGVRNNLPSGQAILDGRYYSCGMLYKAPPRRPGPYHPAPNPYPPGTKGNPGRGHGHH